MSEREEWEKIRDQLATEMEPPKRRRMPGPLAVGLATMWLLSAFYCVIGVFREGVAGDIINAVGCLGFIITVGVSTLSIAIRPPTIVLRPTCCGRRSSPGGTTSDR